MLQPFYKGFPDTQVKERISQIVVDVVFRDSKVVKVCTPHMRQKFFDTCTPSQSKNLLQSMQRIRQQQKANSRAQAGKWSLLEKQESDLSHTLAYSVLQCHRDYTLIVLPLAVSTKGCMDHANMILLQVTGERVQASLFEPNGSKAACAHWGNCPKETEKGSHVEVLQKAVCKANDHLHQVDPALPLFHEQVTVAGGEGIQTSLGISSITVARDGRTIRTSMSQAGFGICGAISYWVLYKWVRRRAKFPTLGAFIEHIEKFINLSPSMNIATQRLVLKQRAIFKKMVMNFIIDVRNRMGIVFPRKLRRAFRNDMVNYVRSAATQKRSALHSYFKNAGATRHTGETAEWKYTYTLESGPPILRKKPITVNFVLKLEPATQTVQCTDPADHRQMLTIRVEE